MCRGRTRLDFLFLFLVGSLVLEPCRSDLDRVRSLWQQDRVAGIQKSVREQSVVTSGSTLSSLPERSQNRAPGRRFELGQQCRGGYRRRKCVGESLREVGKSLCGFWTGSGHRFEHEQDEAVSCLEHFSGDPCVVFGRNTGGFGSLQVSE